MISQARPTIKNRKLSHANQRVRVPIAAKARPQAPKAPAEARRDGSKATEHDAILKSKDQRLKKEQDDFQMKSAHRCDGKGATQGSAQGGKETEGTEWKVGIGPENVSLFL